MITDLRLYLVGWHGYFKHARPRYEPAFGTFDGYVRQRVRSAIVDRVGSGWWNQRIPNRTLTQLGLPSLVTLQAAYHSQGWGTRRRSRPEGRS
jgi:hypothetical protein